MTIGIGIFIGGFYIGLLWYALLVWSATADVTHDTPPPYRHDDEPLRDWEIDGLRPSRRKRVDDAAKRAYIAAMARKGGRR